ncbi:MAG: lantibiotic dehydratase [Actinophytocola sp.]|uniref:lantibiotic dehydratase n=1 Tax=Actinophytocola sp. TaxID=1872138 RepID=UPI001320AB9E|nr:lantibiotic dehydratase [Actinophytocola sp.]MPZ80270.1 lantibiotic dehydratase [Actinophytocola sp.]
MLFRHAGVVMARASTDPGGLDLPESVDLDTEDALGAGRVWLAHLWRRAEVRTALRVASPALSQQVDAIVGGDRVDARQFRRVLITTSSYLRRWQRRATPFGLFAGVAAASADTPATARLGEEHQVAARAGARWLGEIIDGLEQRPDLLPRLPVVVNDAGFTRGDRFVVPARPDESQPRRGAALDSSVRRTKAVAAALAGAAAPVLVAELTQRVGEQFPAAGADKIQRLLAELVASRALITSLRAPMTTVDPLAHLVAELEAVGAEDLPDLAELVTQLGAIREELSSLRSWALPPDYSLALESVAERMRAVRDVPGRVLAVDVVLAGKLTVPEAVLNEAEAAATVLLRLTPFPFGDPVWKDFHAEFLDRYGVGAVVAVRDVVADSGLGYPAGFLGAPRPRAAHLLTERDVTLLTLIQEATAEGRTEITLTEQVIGDLRVGDHAKMVTPARVELAFQLHAVCLDALERGQFQLWITGAPMHANSVAGRFAHLLPDEDRQRLATTYMPTREHTIAAQLSFLPRREHNENITRTPRLLSHVISLAEHRGDDETVIRMGDLAVTADTTQMSLVRISTGERIQPHIPHALETSTQTPPLARFLAEVASARCGAFGPIGFGAAHDLPFHPRIRYGRVVLSAARWLLKPTDLPPARTGTTAWDDALSTWRDRWRVPSTVVLCESDLRLPLDLDDRRDRTLLRTRLERNRTGMVELREAGAHDSRAWAGRACELVVPLTAVPSPDTPPRPRTAPLRTVTRSDALLPGRSSVLRAHLHGHPLRFDDILSNHLPQLFADTDNPVIRWWFWRHHDPARPDRDQHLVLCLRLRAAGDYGTAAAQIADWAAPLRASGLLADLNLGAYQPPRGAFGHGAEAEDAVEDVLATDSAAAITQLWWATRTGTPNQAIAAASLADLAASLAPIPEVGLRRMLDLLPQEHGKLDRGLSETALGLVDADGWARPQRLPDGQTVTRVWDQRRAALAAYRDRFLQDGDGQLVLRTLLHEHHLRAVGVDPGVEKVTNRLARAVAQRRLALSRQGTS